MAQDQSVVDHLLAGRQALHGEVEQAHAERERLQGEIERLYAEVERLTGAIEQLDSVIAMVGSGAITSPPARTTPPPRDGGSSSDMRPVRTSAPAKRSASRARKPSGQAPKSIRVHVLEMLAAEDRDWSLAEIIDRIHGAGIQAHDDAVRSITIKLMKDGRVERVGRGQYRLARRGSSRSSDAVSTPPPATVQAPAAETVSEPAPVSDPIEPAVDEVVETDVVAEPEAVNVNVDSDESDSDATDGQPSEPESPGPENRSYTPPLNLGQPWS